MKTWRAGQYMRDAFGDPGVSVDAVILRCRLCGRPVAAFHEERPLPFESVVNSIGSVSRYGRIDRRRPGEKLGRTEYLCHPKACVRGTPGHGFLLRADTLVALVADARREGRPEVWL